jgi:hypothetical protein
VITPEDRLLLRRVIAIATEVVTNGDARTDLFLRTTMGGCSSRRTTRSAATTTSPRTRSSSSLGGRLPNSSPRKPRERRCTPAASRVACAPGRSFGPGLAGWCTRWPPSNSSRSIRGRCGRMSRSRGRRCSTRRACRSTATTGPTASTSWGLGESAKGSVVGRRLVRSGSTRLAAPCILVFSEPATILCLPAQFAGRSRCRSARASARS